jgi:hypothetical protein
VLVCAAGQFAAPAIQIISVHNLCAQYATQENSFVSGNKSSIKYTRIIELGGIHKKSVFAKRLLRAAFRAEIGELAPNKLLMGHKGHPEERAVRYMAIRISYFFPFFYGLFVKIGSLI